MPAHGRLSVVMLVLIALSLLFPLTGSFALAQDGTAEDVAVAEPVAEEAVTSEQPTVEQPVEEVAQQQAQEEQAPPPPATGTLEIRLTASDGTPLSGLFVVYDAAGNYHERWTDGGVAWLADLIAGTATVYQASGTTDFAFNDAEPAYIDVPAFGHAVLPVTNAFLDADGDTYGDSVDICGVGDDALDTDGDATPDACDDTPVGDPTEEPLPTGEPLPTEEPASNETSEIVAEVAAEPVVVEEARVSCETAEGTSPWIATDLADYPPGSRVTLTGGNWVPGQVIEILVEDDGIADAVEGPWSHAATVTADAQGAFTYQFDLAPWYVADYSVVATGECAEARTTFTDAISVTSANVNGGPSTTVGPGVTISASVTVNRSVDGEAWRSTQWQIAGGTAVCVDTADFTGAAGTNAATFPIFAPAAAGTYNVTFTAFSGSGCTTPVGNQTLVGGVIVTTTASATAIISPNSVPGGTIGQAFTVTITNTSGTTVGSARIAIPSGFTSVQIVSVSSTTGQSDNWSANTTTSPFISLRAENNGNAPLTNGNSVTVTFTATVPSTTGTNTWGTRAWNNRDWSSTSTHAISSQPVVTVTAPQVACTPVVSLTGSGLNFGTLTWTGAAYPSGTGGLAIQISSTGTGCTGFPASWRVTASTSAMNRTGGGSTIPANALSYTGTNSGLPPSNLTPSGATALGSTAQTIATGVATTATGTWNAGFSLAPPASSAPGTYTGTITITVALGSG